MSPVGYIKQIIGDYLLCLGATLALVGTVQAGFNDGNTLPVVAAIVMVAFLLSVLFAGGYSKQAFPISMVLVAVCSIAFLVIASLLSTSDTLLDDSLGNMLIPTLIVVVTVPICYGLTRYRGTTIAFFIVGFVVCALIEFLYRENHWICDIAFLIIAGALIVYRTFACSIRQANVASRTSFTAGFGMSLVMSVAVVGIAVGVFYVVVQPLDPQSATIKLIQEYRRLPEVLAKNPQTVSDEIDTSLYSSTYDDDQRTTSYQKEGEGGVPIPAQNEVAPNEEDQTINGTYSDFDDKSERNGFDLVDTGSQDTIPYALIIVLLILLAIIAAIVIKKLRRRAWYKKLCAQSREQQVVGLYGFYLDRFNRLGIGKPSASTPLEYVSAHADTLDAFAARCPTTSFTDLTRMFMHVSYGGQRVPDDDLAAFHLYYRVFYKNCCKFIGRFAYIRKFFFI